MRGSSMTSPAPLDVGRAGRRRGCCRRRRRRAPASSALPGGPDHERGLAALGDGEDHVARRHAEVGDLLAAEGREVLEALHRLDERVVAARHHALGPALPGVGWRHEQAALPAVLPEGAPDRVELDAQAPGGAAAGEEDPPAALERGDEVVPERLRLARPRPAVVGLHHVPVHVEEDAEAGRGVLAGRPGSAPASGGGTTRSRAPRAGTGPRRAGRPRPAPGRSSLVSPWSLPSPGGYHAGRSRHLLRSSASRFLLN